MTGINWRSVAVTLVSVFITNIVTVVGTIQMTKLTPRQVREAVSIAFTDMSQTRGMYIAEGRGLIHNNATAIAGNAAAIHETNLAVRDMLMLVGKLDERTKR